MKMVSKRADCPDQIQFSKTSVEVPFYMSVFALVYVKLVAINYYHIGPFSTDNQYRPIWDVQIQCMAFQQD